MGNVRARVRARWIAWRAKPVRDRVDSWAKLASISAAVLAIVALWPIWTPPERDAAERTHRTIETSTTRSKEGRPAVTTTSVRTEQADSDTSSITEAILHEAGLFVLIRLAAIATTAFIAGAVVQRILLAKFAIKLGPLELKEPQLDASEVVEILRGGVEALREEARTS